MAGAAFGAASAMRSLAEEPVEGQAEGPDGPDLQEGATARRAEVNGVSHDPSPRGTFGGDVGRQAVPLLRQGGRGR